MKKIFTLVALAFFTVTFGQAQGGIDEMIGALKASNASQAAKLFDNSLEMTLPGKSSSFSKLQAEVVLKDFFANNPVKGFNVVHKGENGGNQYCIGTLVTKSGNYRTTIYMRQRGDSQVLQELKFER